MSEAKFSCTAAPFDTRKYISDIGKILVADHGKHAYYKPKQVRKAHQQSEWSDYDFTCWGMSIYCSRADFNMYHKNTDKIGDYITMRSEMLAGIALPGRQHSSRLAGMNWDASWLDLGELLDGIGDFFSALMDSLDD